MFSSETLIPTDVLKETIPTYTGNESEPIDLTYMYLYCTLKSLIENSRRGFLSERMI